MSHIGIHNSQRYCVCHHYFFTRVTRPLFYTPRSLPNSYFRFRWMALWPLHRRVGHVPGWGHVSLGEAVVAVALVVLAAVWCALTFPHVHGGGRRAVPGNPGRLFTAACQVPIAYNAHRGRPALPFQSTPCYPTV